MQRRAGFPLSRREELTRHSHHQVTTILLPRNLTVLLSLSQRLKPGKFPPRELEEHKGLPRRAPLPHSHSALQQNTEQQQRGIQGATHQQLLPEVNQEPFSLVLLLPHINFLNNTIKKPLLPITMRNVSRFAFLLELATTYFAYP